MTYFLRYDYQGLLRRKPGFNEVVLVLGKEAKARAVEMHQYMTRLRCKTKVQPLKNTTLGSVWNLKYKKYKTVYGFQADVNRMESYVYFDERDSVSELGNKLKQGYPSLFEWYNKYQVEEYSSKYTELSNRLVVTSPDSTDYENMRRTVQLLREKK